MIPRTAADDRTPDNDQECPPDRTFATAPVDACRSGLVSPGLVDRDQAGQMGEQAPE